jgi:hypothetical protein
MVLDIALRSSERIELAWPEYRCILDIGDFQRLPASVSGAWLGWRTGFMRHHSPETPAARLFDGPNAFVGKLIPAYDPKIRIAGFCLRTRHMVKISPRSAFFNHFSPFDA